MKKETNLLPLDDTECADQSIINRFLDLHVLTIFKVENFVNFEDFSDYALDQVLEIAF